MFGLENHYLKQLSSYCLERFDDVIPSDYITEEKLRNNRKYIINLDTSNEPGSHFVAISVRGNTIIYFDSFGQRCSNQHISNAINASKKTLLRVSCIQIQSIKSLFCGYFCLAFLIFDHYGISFDEFLKKFNENDLDSNDSICINIIKSHILMK